MPHVKKKILAIDIVDVTVIAVSPLRWPRIYEHKCVAAVLEPRPALHDLRTPHGEMMASSKLRSEPVFRNATTAITGRTGMILWLTRWLPILFASVDLPSVFLAFGYLLRPRFLARLCVILPLFLLLGFRGLGLILTRRCLHLVLPLRFFLPLRLLLPWFVFLLFFVLCVENCRTRDHCREKS